VGVLLGGSASPIGWSVQFLDADFESALQTHTNWRRALGHHVEVRARRPFPETVYDLLPLEAPWTRELFIPCGQWTAYLNNFFNGGDSTASAVVTAWSLGVRHVMAEHAPVYGPGHAATQLWLSGPTGEPPLMSIRTVGAVATEGRWQWVESGQPQPFEDLSRYGARRKRDRLDRALLVQYLEAIGIPADDDDAYGEGVLVQGIYDWSRRTQSLSEARRELGLPEQG
jgi:hypothetical protein